MVNYEELWKNKKAELALNIDETSNVSIAVTYAKELAEMELQEHKMDAKVCNCNVECGDTEKKHESQDDTEQMFMDLERYAVPFVKFINDRFGPHSAVIISDGLVRVMTDEIGVPVTKG